jgi:hypothetical protein
LKHLFLIFGLIVFSLNSWSLNDERQAFWQQRTKLNIVVNFNPAKNELSSTVGLWYENNSPDTLKFIAFHVWGNAFKDQSSAYAKQLIAHGKDEFYFSQAQDKGYVDSLKFIENGQFSNELKFDKLNPDIVFVILNKALAPHQSVYLDYSFSYKIPKLMSRGGFSQDIIALTQWYPKPAVYDFNKWNSIPYLEQGEFYSEYCDSISVRIKLPSAYKIAASGNLIENIILIKGQSEPMREVLYSENYIHDFAFFISKRFDLVEKKVKLNNGDSVLIQWYTLDSFSNKTSLKYSNKNVLQYLEAALNSFNTIGKYAYKSCKVVIGPQNAGEGMEYPTITICKDDSPETIFHEIGHNWFYGMIGSNERKHPWMDESLNTYYSTKFVNQFNHQISRDFVNDSNFFKKQNSSQFSVNHSLLLAYQLTASQGKGQAVALESDKLFFYNYGVLLYAKGPLLFAYLNQVLGDSLFDLCIKNYFSKWRFKHPLPGDIKDCFENISGQNLNWFFDELLTQSKPIDVVFRHGKYFIKGAPLLDSLCSKNRAINPNPFGFLPEQNFNNNGQKKTLISLRLPMGLPTYHALVRLDLMPIVGYNYYDKVYAGLIINHHFLNTQKYQFALMPAWSFTQKKLIGYARISGNIYNGNNRLSSVSLGLQGQTFSLAMASRINQYYRVNPFVKFNFKSNDIDKQLEEKYFLVNMVKTGITQKYYLNAKNSQVQFPNYLNLNYLRGSFVFDNHHPINRIGFKWNSEYGYNYNTGNANSQYAKTWLNLVYKYKYDKGKKFFRTEFFGGLFLKKSNGLNKEFDVRMFSVANNGNNDYLFQEALLGRSEISSGNILLSNQLISGGGNMRNLIPVSSSDRWMLALNNDVNLPGIIPLKLYLDLAYFGYTNRKTLPIILTKPELYYTAGLSLELFHNTLEIFVPLVYSKQFKGYKYWNYNVFNSIGFKLNINQLEPSKLIQNFILENKFKIPDSL